MRDFNRIDIILDEVRDVWKRFPDQRLGQLISNFVERDIKMLKNEDITQFNERRHLRAYNMEDDKLLELIKEFRKEYET